MYDTETRVGDRCTRCWGERLGGREAVLDGEIVVYNPDGQVDFGLLQERRRRYRRYRGTGPFQDPVAVRFLAFDLLRLGEQVWLGEPYDRR